MTRPSLLLACTLLSLSTRLVSATESEPHALNYPSPSKKPSWLRRSASALYCERWLLLKTAGLTTLGLGLALGGYSYARREVTQPFSPVTFEPSSGPESPEQAKVLPFLEAHAAEVPVLRNDPQNLQGDIWRLKVDFPPVQLADQIDLSAAYKRQILVVEWDSVSPASRRLWALQDQVLRAALKRLDEEDQLLLQQGGHLDFYVSVVLEDATGRAQYPLIRYLPKHHRLSVILVAHPERTLRSVLNRSPYADRLELETIDEATAEKYLREVVAFIRKGLSQPESSEHR